MGVLEGAFVCARDRESKRRREKEKRRERERDKDEERKKNEEREKQRAGARKGNRARNSTYQVLHHKINRAHIADACTDENVIGILHGRLEAQIGIRQHRPNSSALE